MTPANPVAVIMTALPVEAQAVLQHVQEPRSQQIGQYVFDVGKFNLESSVPWEVAVIEVGAGNVESAVGASQAAIAFSPAVILFVGIAGALKDVSIGDVVIASDVAWTERGKATDDGYVQRIRTATLSTPLTQWGRRIVRSQNWSQRLPTDDPGAVFVGQIASGEDVIASAERRGELQNAFSDALAIENEGWGVARTADLLRSAETSVIRGICDDATANKHDDAHPRAAAAAAAVAFELLDLYGSAIQLAATSETPSRATRAANSLADLPGGEDKDSSRRELLEALVGDVDILGDDQSEVETFAAEAASKLSGPEESEQLVSGLVLELQKRPASLLIRRRLMWFGRRLVRARAHTDLDAWEVEEILRAAPWGGSVLFADPPIFASLSPQARRRVLTALTGPPDRPALANEEDVELVIPLGESGALTASESKRAWRALRTLTYADLHARGASVAFLAQALLEDLASGDFSLQNPAARFLDATARQGAGLEDSTEVRLGAALVRAAHDYAPAFGADEALQLKKVSVWPEARLYGGIWAATTGPDGATFAPAPSKHFGTLIAAAAARGSLRQTLVRVQSLLVESIREVRQGRVTELCDDIEALAVSLREEDAAEIEVFAEWVRTQWKPKPSASRA